LSSNQERDHAEDFFFYLFIFKPYGNRKYGPIITYTLNIYGVGHLLQTEEHKNQNLFNFQQYMFNEFEPETRTLLEGQTENAKTTFHRDGFRYELNLTIPKQSFDLFYNLHAGPFLGV
jgi:hypothetical protein